jgi:hypothetical protein
MSKTDKGFMFGAESCNCKATFGDGPETCIELHVSHVGTVGRCLGRANVITQTYAAILPWMWTPQKTRVSSVTCFATLLCALALGLYILGLYILYG